MIARTDYAASMGELLAATCSPGTGPGSLAAGDSMTDTQWYTYGCECQGVIYCHSTCRIEEITDGTSNTLLAGEKYLDPDNYATGQNWGDDQGWDLGADWDVNRLVGLIASEATPLTDWPGLAYATNWGSPHLAGFNMALCDGSIRMFNYSIDLETLRRLGDKADGLKIDAKSF